jgi:hypothetical protein
MKKKLKLLISSAAILLNSSPFLSTHGMESFQKPENHLTAASSSVVLSNKQLSHSFDDFLNANPILYHQVSTEKYRISVHTLRQDIMKLQEKLSSFGTSSEASIIQKEIENLKQIISFQQQAFSKYGTDQSVAKERIMKEIMELEQIKQNNQQNIIDNPKLKGLYEAQISDADTSLQICQKYLASLEKSESTLKSTLETTERYLKTIDQHTSSTDHLKEVMTEKIRNLKHLYQNHTNGLCSLDVFTHNLPKEVFESLGISSKKLNNINSERLFQLFARSIELPYFSIETGEEIDKAYVKHLEIISQNFTNRLYEDVFAFKVCLSIVSNGRMQVDFLGQDKHLKNFVENEQFLEDIINRDLNDAEVLKNILSKYGDKDHFNASQFLSDIVNKSSYGLLGLCITSLESFPVYSWNSPIKIIPHVYMDISENKEEILKSVRETIYTFLGHYINKIVLDKITESFRKKTEKLSTPQHVNNFYV